MLQLSSGFDPDAQYLRLEVSGESATGVREVGPYPVDPEVVVPVDDSLADVAVRVAGGGKSWKKGGTGTVQTLRLSPDGSVVDAATGDRLT
ncbi:hypothetical protein [Streptomyces sp. DH12]|uniref:hypothetical protein n=1 Tax=Streptomyces sp. DH12 TaxID=2857010 RepID=UPI001E45D9B3|nr:hypothetical protein [Streptomyces sp. DH12]